MMIKQECDDDSSDVETIKALSQVIPGLVLRIISGVALCGCLGLVAKVGNAITQKA